MKRKRSGEALPIGQAGGRITGIDGRRARTGAPGRVAMVLGAALILLLPLGLAAKKKAPPTKTVQGEILDASNRPIVGAAVELTDETTHKKFGIYSEAGGHYRFTGLTPTDDYAVKATYHGQQSDVRHASSLDDRSIMVLDLTVPAPSPQ